MSEARTTGQAFERSPAFDLQRFAESSFGTFQEKKRSRWCCASMPGRRGIPAAFRFHPTQSLEEKEKRRRLADVCLKAGGLDKIGCTCSREGRA